MMQKQKEQQQMRYHKLLAGLEKMDMNLKIFMRLLSKRRENFGCKYGRKIRIFRLEFVKNSNSD